VEVIDITAELVQLFNPSKKTLTTIAQLADHPPLDLDTIEQGHDH
jgi:hypothetical protein